MNRLAKRIAGVDEAGRGPLAGPVVAAAVVFRSGVLPDGLADSKVLTARRRQRLECEIQAVCADWGIGYATVAEIDSLNILQATMLAMRRAVLALRTLPTQVLVDGNRCPSLPCAVRSIVGGDATVPVISAASILAKEARDRYMQEQARRYPGYGFDKHKGYPTRAHREALERLGATPIHRVSFAPVRRVISSTLPT